MLPPPFESFGKWRARKSGKIRYSTPAMPPAPPRRQVGDRFVAVSTVVWIAGGQMSAGRGYRLTWWFPVNSVTQGGKRDKQRQGKEPRRRGPAGRSGRLRGRLPCCGTSDSVVRGVDRSACRPTRGARRGDSVSIGRPRMGGRGERRREAPQMTASIRPKRLRSLEVIFRASAACSLKVWLFQRMPAQPSGLMTE